jgi:hypothetical protein
MDHNTTADDRAAVALVLLALGVETVARHLLAPALALLLTLLSYRRPWPGTTPTAPPAPAPRPAPSPWPFPFPMPAPVVATTREAFYEALTVHQLRQMARNKGHRALARSGRRAQLLEVLA